MPFAGYPSFALANFWREEAGVSFMEFALVASLVLVFCTLLLLAWSKSA
jgi:Flp pilus assembly pilin Flp